MKKGTHVNLLVEGLPLETAVDSMPDVSLKHHPDSQAGRDAGNGAAFYRADWRTMATMGAAGSYNAVKTGALQGQKGGFESRSRLMLQKQLQKKKTTRDMMNDENRLLLYVVTLITFALLCYCVTLECRLTRIQNVLDSLFPVVYPSKLVYPSDPKAEDRLRMIDNADRR